MAWLNWSLKLHIWLRTISLLISTRIHMPMFNECHIHLCDCTWLNVFSHAQSLLIKHKNIFECFSCFWKIFCFYKNVKNFKNSVALFWRLSRGLIQLHVPVAIPHRDFRNSLASQCHSRKKYLEYFSKFEFLTFLMTQTGDLFVGENSNREGYTKIFVAYLATPSWVELPVVKKT